MLLLRLQREDKEIEFYEKRGRLMTIDDYDRAVGDAFRRVAVRLHGLARRLVPDIVGLRTAGQANEIAQAAVNEVLEEVHKADDVPEPPPLKEVA